MKKIFVSLTLVLLLPLWYVPSKPMRALPSQHRFRESAEY